MTPDVDPLDGSSAGLARDGEGARPRKTRLLVVEDDARIAQFLVKGLAADGHEVVVAEDGDVGLFLVTSEWFDTVVLDLTLPGRSGLDVLAHIRAQRLSVPVVVLTGHDDPAARQGALSAGASAFVTKPLAFEELRGVLRELLERPGSPR